VCHSSSWSSSSSRLGAITTAFDLRCFVCRYLVCGSDSASLYLEVLSVDDQDITCEAKNGAVMDGLMTVRNL
jgi:hypothetical protein